MQYFHIFLTKRTPYLFSKNVSSKKLLASQAPLQLLVACDIILADGLRKSFCFPSAGDTHSGFPPFLFLLAWLLHPNMEKQQLSCQYEDKDCVWLRRKMKRSGLLKAFLAHCTCHTSHPGLFQPFCLLLNYLHLNIILTIVVWLSVTFKILSYVNSHLYFFFHNLSVISTKCPFGCLLICRHRIL